MNVDVSVIVLTHNRPARCEDSVTQNAKAMQGLRAEVLVINNGQQAVPLPPQIGDIACRILQMPYNMGAEARNIGLREARGEFILALDDDSYIDPGLVEAMLAAFRPDPAIGAVACRIQNGATEEACLLPTVFHGCAAGFRKRAMERVGGYPEGYLYYGEEYDLAFRLYQAGYRIALCNHARKVRHVRDGGGRDKNNIIKLLIRNNTHLWFRFLPWNAILPAVYDTVQRYYNVARKERALRGFWRGMAETPAAAFRGLRRRRPMDRATYEKVALVAQLRGVGAKLRRLGAGRLVICGVGKLPSLWLRTLRDAGCEVAAFWDFNDCWTGRRIRGVPVRVVGARLPPAPANCQFLVGTTSLAENTRWQNQLIRGGLTATETRWVALPQETSAYSGSFDLHRVCCLDVFNRENGPENEVLKAMASSLLSYLPAE